MIQGISSIKFNQPKIKNQSIERLNGRLAAKLVNDRNELYRIIRAEAGNAEFIAGICESLNECKECLKKIFA